MPFEDAERVRFQQFLPEMQDAYLRGWMPIAVAEKHGFPVAVVQVLFARLQTAERLGMPLPYPKLDVVFFAEKDAKKQKYNDLSIETLTLKRIGLAGGVVAGLGGCVYSGYLFLIVLRGWIFAFADACLPFVVLLGQCSIPAFLAWMGWKWFFGGSEVNEVEKEKAGDTAKVSNITVNVNVNQ